ncbi:MAG: gliding motility-associated C-terminal domain-containing protein [Flavobacteriales bacterium]|nr:gliding motility-associated C-terminal domain-containing protein [Flavobacteriales bacterium]MCB9166467.1 gliding motility-associated C-terminal domain-containing protein [Flavobacteriales bacterium]
MARKLITLLFAGLFMANTAHATHVTGAEIIWNCVGNGQYDFSLIIYRDCAGTTLDQTYTLDMTSPCGNTSVTVTQQSFTEVSQLCPDDIGNSSCNGGPLPGIQAYIYTGSLSNLAPCDSWTISWDLCCRNNAIVNLTDPGNQDGYIEAVMNNADFPCNDSPQFTNAPIPYVCLGSPVFYSYGAFDPDGDSLSYSFVSAMGGGGAPLGYNFPYSAIEPITGITLDPLTGLVSFTPTVQGNFVVVVQVQEFDGNGNLIGTVLRDMQFVAIPCTNNPPNPFAGAIQNFNGSAIQTGDFSIELCESNNFCFTATYDDPDATDTLSLTSNILQNLPGATITYTGINPVTATICWTAQPGTSGFFPFTVTVEDDACPINGEQTFVYAVNVLQRTSAGPDQTICGPQVAQLQAEGGSLFTWSVMSGDPMQLGVNFSCNPCDAPIADPNNTTTYIVVSDLAGTCINSDTVTVNVVPDFSFLATQSDTLICLGETVDFNVAVNPNVPGYQFEWIPDEGLTSSSIPNPTGIYGNPGYYTYNVGITSPDGCYHQDTSLAVTVTPGYVPQFSVSQNDSLVCEGNSTQFFVDLDCSLPGFCGTYDGPCCGPISTMDVGDGTDYLANTAYPAIYGQWYTGARHQILFTASELQALGFAGGKISEIGWNIAQIPATAATTFYQFEIKIGCTTQEELISGAWISGLTTVFPADTIQIVPGWNTYQFDHGFNWDGTSNLVVEVCFDFWDLFGTDFTLNSPTYYTTTAFNSVHQWHSDQGGICSDTPNGFAIESVETERPNTRFVFCGGVSADELTYTWTPAIGLDDPSAQNPVVTPQSAPTTYTVTVGELGSGCAASADLTVGWFPPANVSFVPNPDEGVFPLTVFFQNTSASGSNNFNWNFGDGNGSGDSDPNHIYVDPGTYYITLTGLSENGCFGTYTDSIVVLPNPIVEIPNVFSPDNDGHNDVFEYIDLRGFRNVKMTIYDRWGTVVYEAPATTSNKVIWQPKAQVNDGTYFYLFEGQGNDGSDVKRQGHITLVRRPK